jgi:hypothetical protein
MECVVVVGQQFYRLLFLRFGIKCATWKLAGVHGFSGTGQ